MEPEAASLGFSEAMDLAFGSKRENVLKVVNAITCCLLLLCVGMLFMSYGDHLVFCLVLGFLAMTVAFAAAFNW